MKKFFLGFGLILTLVGCQNRIPEEQETSETIKIGAPAPLSGDMAAYGIEAQRVTNLITKQINEAGGINGRKIELIWEDDKCTPGDASRAVQKLINMDKVKLIFGTACSGGTLAAAPIIEKNKVIFLTPFATNPTIRDAGDFIFRNVPSDSSQGEILAEYALKKGYKKIGILAEQTDYAKGVADVFESTFTGEKLRENYLDTESDFKTRITKLKSAGIDALMVSNQSPPKADIILKQMQEQDWNVPLLHNEVITGTEDIKTKYRDFLTKVQAVGANFVAPQSPLLEQFKQEYLKEYNEPIKYENYAAAEVDAMHIFQKILSEAKDPDNTDELKQALYNLTGFVGLYGDITFDTYGEINFSHSLFRFDGENFVPLQE